MGKSYSYYERLGHLPPEVQEAIKELKGEKKRRMAILADLGVKITLEDVEEIKSLTKESDIDRFARKLMFSC